MVDKKRVVFLFPGQGAQYPGMGKDFAERYPAARYVIEEADDLLKRHLSRIIFQGSEAELTETKNSQAAIFTVSFAILAVLRELFPKLQAETCAGLSLGEYTALAAGGWISFRECLSLVQMRSRLMNEACEKNKGAMAVVAGLDAETVKTIVQEINKSNDHRPNDLWAANFISPGQVVVSGTLKGIEAAEAVFKARGAKRFLLLQVHGAFHSGLMQYAEDQLRPYLERALLVNGDSALVMNVPGDFVEGVDQVRRCLIKQVTSPVLWEQGIRAIEKKGADLYVEIGCGKSLSGMNKRIAVLAPTISIEKIDELDILAQALA